MNYEYKVELIANQSVQDDIVEFCEDRIKDFEYTIVADVQGKGLSARKQGSSTWPEMNFFLFSYVSKDAAMQIKSAVEEIKKRFPKEGISLFVSKVEML